VQLASTPLLGDPAQGQNLFRGEGASGDPKPDYEVLGVPLEDVPALLQILEINLPLRLHFQLGTSGRRFLTALSIL